MKLNVMKIHSNVRNELLESVSDIDVDSNEFIYDETVRKLLDLYRLNVEHEIGMNKLYLRNDWGSGERKGNVEMIDSVLRSSQSVFLDLQKNLLILKETVKN